MRLTFAILLLTSLGLVLSRCVREVPIDLPVQPAKIVALSHFSPNHPIRVEVSLSQTFADAGDPLIPYTADVSIAVEGKFLDQLTRAVDDGGRIYWESSKLVMPEIPYSLSVRVSGKDPVEAVSAAPKPVKLEQVMIDTAQIRLVELADGKRAMRVPLLLQLPAKPRDNFYFAFNLRHEIEAFELVDGQPVPDEYYEASTKFLAEGRTLALIYDTPENVVLISENFWSDGNRIFTLDALIPYDPQNERPRRLFVEWHTLSEEFYRYHLSLARQGQNLPLFDPDALYNNINGGYGNFSGFSFTVDTLLLPNHY